MTINPDDIFNFYQFRTAIQVLAERKNSRVDVEHHYVTRTFKGGAGIRILPDRPLFVDP
jgi:hypothetical protein